VFYVAADVNQSATANDVFALSALTNSAVTVGALTAGDGIHTVDPITFPMQTGANIVGATIDTMTVSFTDILPTTIQQNQLNVPTAKVNVKASNNTVIWQGLTVQRTGANPDDTDILHVNVWEDINDNGIFDDGNPVPAISLAATIGSSDNTLQVAISSSYPVGPGVLYIDNELIRYTLNDGTSTFTGLTRGFLGTTPAGHAQNRTVYGVVNDTLIGDNLVKPGLVTNGTNNFTSGTATMTFVTPQIVPNGSNRPTGVNYFVTYDINPFAPVYRDPNGVQSSTTAVGIGLQISGASSFNVLAPKIVSLTSIPPLLTKTATITEYPDVVTFTPDDSIAPTSETQGTTDVPIMKFTLKTPVSFARWTNLKLQRQGQGAVQTQGSNDDVALIKIYRDANFDGLLEPNIDVLIGTGTFVTPDPTGAQTKVAIVNLLKTELLNPTPQTYFIAYDIAVGATSNNAEGVTIQDPGWFSGSFVPNGPDTVSAANFPHNSREVTISPLFIKVVGTNLAPDSALQGSTNIPFEAITITPSINQVIISTLTITQTGTLQLSTSPVGARGDGDLSKIYVYLDSNNNGAWDASDTLMGSLPWGPGGGQFQGGRAAIPLSVPVTFNTSGGTLILTADIGASAIPTDTVGLAISSAAAITLSPSTALQDPANAYPVASRSVPIFNLQTVQISTVSVRPDLTLSTNSPVDGTFFPSAWIDRQDQVNVYWLTNPFSPPSNVTLTYQLGVSASSDTTKAPNILNWVTFNQAPPVTLTGLGLADGGVYYVFIRTLTTVSGIPLSPSPVALGTVHVDITQPIPPATFINLPKSAPSGVITVQWPHTTLTGPSGLFIYKMRQYTDGNPVPTEILEISTPSFTFGANTNSSSAHSAGSPLAAGHIAATTVTPPVQFMNGETGGPREGGHFYRYQIQTINNAGTASAWSDISDTVNTGLPTEIITKVSNYPNPVDTRKGGLEGHTVISYLLASDAQVDITVYDLLGYRVMHWSFPAGSPGGIQGPNQVPPGGWDGTNEAGQKVSKGGYLAQIKVSGGAGSSTVIRKIGVIH
jgi:hypothetical protein